MHILQFVMFNMITRFFLNKEFLLLDWHKRIRSMLLTILYTSAVLCLCMALLYMPVRILSLLFPDQDTFDAVLYTLMFAVIKLLILNKDFFNAQSVTHRFLGYQVIDIKTDAPAGKVKCMLRNLTAVLWPIEAIFILTSPERRLGDLIAGTKLIDVPPTDPELILSDMKAFKMNKDSDLALLISAAIAVATGIFL